MVQLIAKSITGAVIMTYAGRDATDVFSSFHAASSWRLLRPICIGELEVLIRFWSDLIMR